MFSRPKILFLVSLLFVALLNSIPTYLLNFIVIIVSSGFLCTFMSLIIFVSLAKAIQCTIHITIQQTTVMKNYLKPKIFEG